MKRYLHFFILIGHSQKAIKDEVCPRSYKFDPLCA